MPSSTQLRYAAAYFLITIAVLLFLNIYAPMTIRNLVFRAQKTAMEDKAQLFVSSLSALTAMDSQTVHDAVESVDDLHTNRVIVTDPQGLALYDSLERDNAEGKLALLPQIVEALSGNDVFYITYRDGALESQAAMPIMAYNKLVGAVYLMEYDTDQGALIAALQTNILRISAVLAGAVALFIDATKGENPAAADRGPAGAHSAAGAAGAAAAGIRAPDARRQLPDQAPCARP